MNRFQKYILSPLLVLQMAFGPSAYSGIDFGDDGSVITAGPDKEDGRDDGNCIGGGCNDGGEGHSSGDDYDDNGEDYDGSELHDGGDSESHGNRDYDDHDRKTQGSGKTNSKYAALQLMHAPRDRGDGVIFTRDSKGNVYHQGSAPKLEVTDQGDYFSPDHRDIFYNHNGTPYVISENKSKLLPIEGITACAQNGSCGTRGYREDWWNYSELPHVETSDEASRWHDIQYFYEKQLELQRKIENAWENPAITGSNEKSKILREVEYLHAGARSAFAKSQDKEAEALQQGAKELAVFIADVGIGVSPLGWAKDAYEVITGTRLVDGKALTDGERLMAGIGVMMPGVGSLAFAGMKIISRNPLARKGVQNAVREAEKIAEILGDLKAIRFREGKNTTEVAIIGRDMKYVNEAAERLNTAGIKTRIFTPSTSAINDLNKQVVKNGNQMLGYDEIPSTLVYKEDMIWSDQIRIDDISAVDIGNPSKKSVPSRFYDDEIPKIFGR